MLILGLLGMFCDICHEVLTFIQIGCGHTVRVDNLLEMFYPSISLCYDLKYSFEEVLKTIARKLINLVQALKSK